uniref:LisH domain-containing protein n=1 Tax=Panagrellus redivivus TaxID=6233 RepID=A0A7E4V1B9_PANRE
MPASLNVLISEYLQVQGFTKTAAVFEDELNSEVGLQDSVEKMILQIFSYIENYNLDKLFQVWQFLHEKVFNVLSETQSKTAADLENTIYKLYVVNCVKNGKSDKTTEFFKKISEIALGNAVWTDWFALPYVKNPETEKTFEKYFLPQWQAAQIIWLHNFLSLAFEQVDKCRLVSCVEKGMRASLNDSIASNASQAGPSTPGSSFETGLVDDFSVIAQCGTPGSKTSYRSFKSIFKNMGKS